MSLLSQPLLFKNKYLVSIISGALLLTACGKSTNKHINAQPLTIEQLASLPSDSAAHWLTTDTLLTNKQGSFELIQNIDGDLSKVSLTETALPSYVAERYPHLTQFHAYKVPVTHDEAKTWLKRQLMVVSKGTSEDKANTISYVQTGEVIDFLYTNADNDADETTDLGAKIIDNGVQFKLWAPTAISVSVLAYQNETVPDKPSASFPMSEDKKSGLWQLQSTQIKAFDYYQYQVEVYHPESKKIETLITTDPYSLSLSTNSTHSQVVDLSDRATKPTFWDNHTVPEINVPEDNILYETHIRDFSAGDLSIQSANIRGKYLAFSETDSDGIKHLKSLKEAGLNNVHLLPAFDIGTVNENGEQVIDINDPISKLCQQLDTMPACETRLPDNKSIIDVLSTYDPAGTKAQQLVSDMRQLDNYNWGYDPYHFTVPEGSYATNSMGVARIIEFREMVKSLHNMGFRVIMDVVYNHTHQYGLAKNSVLDKIVPGYYHRLNPVSGEVEQSTCYTCGNTATERVMMAKLMNDSLVTWAQEYKVDGFRFDLMGHQPKQAMLKAREAVRVVDPDTYFYGEGWNFGEVANNSRFVQASQLELGGSEIGTFSDRLRDAVRGPGNNTRDSQGIGNGLFTLPNEKQQQDKSLQHYHLAMDQLRIGLAGNLAHYQLGNKLGKDIPYGDQPTGYALDPADTINYVSKHDNQTLWDNSQYRLAFDVSTADRIRMHNMSISYAMFAQGIPFLHMGSEFLRSKSFLRDSYDYGDWFNAVDYTMAGNNYNVGLPPADKDKDNWPLINEVLKGHQGKDKVSGQDIKFSADVFKDMLAIRTSSPLFKLTTAEQIMAKLSFANLGGESHQKGLIVMVLDDTKGEPVDANLDSIVAVFNNNNSEQFVEFENTGLFKLHDRQQSGADEQTKLSKVSASGFTIPALTSAVFVKGSQ